MPRHTTQVPNADPLVCAYTLLASVPVLFFGFLYADKSLGACLALTFFAGQEIIKTKNLVNWEISEFTAQLHLVLAAPTPYFSCIDRLIIVFWPRF